MILRKNYFRSSLTLAVNALVLLLFASITRVVFYLDNSLYFNELSTSQLIRQLLYGIKFDISGLIHFNLLYLFLISLPLHWKENDIYQRVCKWIYVISNSLFLLINLCDTVYFKYVGKRTTFSVFSEFGNDHNLIPIFLEEAKNHWYLLILAIVLIFLLYKWYFLPPKKDSLPLWKYYTVQVPMWLLVIFLSIIGIRGGYSIHVHSLSIADAKRYVKDPSEVAIVLNTPFSMIRTIGKADLAIPDYYKGKNKLQLDSVYTPLHFPQDTTTFIPKNVVVIILESMGKEYSGLLNPNLDNGQYKGYTPFLDSLRKESLYCEHSFAHGRQSVDAFPAVLSSIPKVYDNFMLTPYAMNKYQTIPSLLKKKGYHTSFFFGSPNGSMGFDGFNRAGGVEHIFQKNEYPHPEDFDGWWGIWDEPYLQYFAHQLSTFQQPFATTLFTISSHHPYHIPPSYEGKFPLGTLPIHKCIGYTDQALRKFFKTASQQAWYNNTVFVLCSDHTNQTEHDEYMTSIGCHEIQILFYSPSGDLKGKKEGIAQQIDILPTIMGYLHYDEPYVAFGCDLLATPAEETWAFNWYNGFFQYMKNDYAILWDGTSNSVNFMYNFVEDPLLKENLVHTLPDVEQQLFLELKSLVAQYMDRMVHDKLTVQSNQTEDAHFSGLVEE